MSSSEWIPKKVEEMDELTAKTELANILQKYSEIGIQGYNKDDLIKDIKRLYEDIGRDRHRHRH